MRGEELQLTLATIHDSTALTNLRQTAPLRLQRAHIATDNSNNCSVKSSSKSRYLPSYTPLATVSCLAQVCLEANIEVHIVALGLVTGDEALESAEEAVMQGPAAAGSGVPATC